MTAPFVKKAVTLKAVEVRDLVKSYEDVQAVKGISFDVEEGSFFAFLGPNGAGKSTTISILCSLLSKDSGEIKIFGKDPVDAHPEVGIVFQENMLDPKLTVRENVTVRGSMYGFEKVELSQKVQTALEKSDAVEFADRPYGKLSGGQRRRADIARALVHQPRLLMLDEPTAGLDPSTRELIWRNIKNLKDEGMTVFLTTHYMEEAADADDIVIIRSGEIIAQGTPAVLKERYSSDYLDILPKDSGRVESYLKDAGMEYELRVDVYRIPLDETVQAIPIIEDLKDVIESFEVRTGTLDDAFIRITGGIEE